MRKAIIIFTKVPSLGYSKTRLQSVFSPEKVEKISIHLLEKTIATARAVDADIFMYATPKEKFDQLQAKVDCQGISIYPQNGQSLGVRMFQAMEEVLGLGYDQVILFGSDIYNLSSRTIEEGFKQLNQFDITIAPSEDGGYGLIGMKEPLSVVFELPAYSHEQVLHQLLFQCQKYGLSYGLLNQLRDIDTPEDIVKFLTGDDEAYFLAQGEYNANFVFDGGRKLLRIALASQLHLDQQIKYEYDTLKAIESSSVTPKALDYIPYSPLIDSAYLIEEFLPGRPLAYETDALIAAELLAKVHQVDPNSASHLIKAEQPFQVMMDEFESMFAIYQQSELANPVIKGRIEKLLDILKANYDLGEAVARPCIINTELNSHNFLINPGETSYIIDWEKPLIGDCEQDLAHFLAPTTTLWRTDYLFSQQEIQQFIEVYNQYAHHQVDVARLNQYLLFTCLRGITWCAMAYIQYLETGKDQQHPDSFQVISSYLEVGFIAMIEEYFEKRGVKVHGKISYQAKSD